MVWQDVGFGIISIILSIVLIPQFFDVVNFRIRINIASGLLTGAALAIMAMMYGTLNLPLASITSWITAAMWIIMAIYSKPRKRIDPEEVHSMCRRIS